MASIPPTHPFAAYCSLSADATHRAIRHLGPHIKEDGSLKKGSSKKYTPLLSSASRLLNMTPMALAIAIRSFEQLKISSASGSLKNPSQDPAEPICDELFTHFFKGCQGGVITQPQVDCLTQVFTHLTALEVP